MSRNYGITPTSFLPIKAAGEGRENKYGQRNSRHSILTEREGRKHHAREGHIDVVEEPSEPSLCT